MTPYLIAAATGACSGWASVICWRAGRRPPTAFDLLAVAVATAGLSTMFLGGWL